MLLSLSIPVSWNSSFKLIHTCILLLITTTIFSTNYEYSFDHITTKDGLSQNNVNCILQDSIGFLWIGTNDGLNRYDGYDFKVFRVDLNTNRGLSSNIIHSIIEGKNGNIWIGTANDGISTYNYRLGKFNEQRKPAILSKNMAKDLISFDNNEIWFRNEKGLHIVKNNSVNAEVKEISNKEISGSQSSKIRVLRKSTENIVWLATKSQLYKCIRKFENGEINIKFQQIHYSDTEKNSIRDVIIYENGILVASTHGIFHINSNEGWSQISNIDAIKLLIDSKDNLWVGTRMGLFLFKPHFNENKLFVEVKGYFKGDGSGTINSNIISCLFEDSFGIIWIGTIGGGINKLNPNAKKFKHYKSNVGSENIKNYAIRSIFQDKNKNIWIGTLGGGMSVLQTSKYNNNVIQFSDLNTLNGFLSDVYALHEISIKNKNAVITGTDYHLKNNAYFIDDRSQLIKQTLPGKLQDITHAIFAYDLGTDFLWIATYENGLYRYHIKNNTLDHFKTLGKSDSLKTSIIRNVFCDSKGNVWIGTNMGLHVIPEKSKGDKVLNYKSYHNITNNNKSISYNYILPIFESSKGNMWIGTLGGGLNKFNSKDESFQRITTNDGLPNNAIKGILEDAQGNLWVSSNKGISKVDPSSLKITNYDITDGLQDYEFVDLAYCKLHSGEMMFGGVNGINAFYPNEIKGDTTLPRVVFTDFSILNQNILPGKKFNGRIIIEKSISYTDEVILKYKENSFSINFTGIHLIAPSKIKYKYKLEGFEQDWVTASSNARFAKYTSIPAGNYTFKVMAANNDGLWNTNPLTLYVSITQPLWLSKMAILTYALFAILFFVFFRKYSIIRIKMKNALLMDHFEKEKTKELSQMKLRFFTNISHEFRTPLTLIIGYLEKHTTKLKKYSDLNNNEELSVINRNARILLRLINQLMDFRKFEQGKMKLRVRHNNLVEFVTKVYESFKILAETKNIKYSFSKTKEEMMLWFDTDIMEKILYNLLSNAFKYTQENESVKVSIKEQNDKIVIEVGDTGIGMSEEQTAHVFERFYHSVKINRSSVSTGIGLAFSKGLVELHKGTIELTSEEGIGTTFYLSFLKGNVHFSSEELGYSKIAEPLEIINESGFDSIQFPKSEENATLKRSSNDIKLLIVEDNNELQKLLLDGFKDKYNVVNAENGKVGFEMCTKELPDIVISDIMMPVMDGYDMCKKLKNDKRTSHIPIILLTAKTLEEHQLLGFNSGADAYVTKPFNFEVLKAQINAIFESKNRIKEIFKKCLDVKPGDIAVTSVDEKIISKVFHIVEENLSNPDFTVFQLVKELSISQSTLIRKLKMITGESPRTFIRSMRIKRAAKLIVEGNSRVNEAAYAVGIFDIQYFGQCFKDEFGMTPTEYKKQYHVK